MASVFRFAVPALAMIVAACCFGRPVDDDDPPPPKAVFKGSAQATKPQPIAATASLGVDELLGNGGRKRHAERLSEAKVGGKTFGWDQYVAWGKELFFEAQVQKPPVGEAPSKPLSDHYKCIQCHNNRREDRVLTNQDPEDRVAWINEHPPQKGEAPLRMQPGTTLWGAVNRESFYNDSYDIYHTLTLAGGRVMNPRSLEDATQTCCKYCSVGRIAEPWEIDSLLAYQWELEVRLGDLDLPPSVEREVAATLTAAGSARDPRAIHQSRELLRRLYLRRAGDTYTAAPKELQGKSAGLYGDKVRFAGDAKIGAKTYAVACDHCHGEGKPNDSAGSALIRDLKRFHTILSNGTHQDERPYMPMFSSQRLSRQQIADVEAYLKSL